MRRGGKVRGGEEEEEGRTVIFFKEVLRVDDVGSSGMGDQW